MTPSSHVAAESQVVQTQEKLSENQYSLGNIPLELIGSIISEVINYQDQYAVLSCCKDAIKWAPYIKKTHINRLSAQQATHPYIGSLTNLEFLCVSDSTICHVPFTSHKLKGLMLKNAVVHSSLFNQTALQYLDVRAMQSLSCLPDLIKENSGLVVLKTNVIGVGAEETKNLSNLVSIELVDINTNLNLLGQLGDLKYLKEIVLSSYTVGRFESHYKQAFKIIDQKISLPGLKTIVNSGQATVSYTGTELKKYIANFCRKI